MAHGTQDAVIALGMAGKSKAILASHGYDIEWHEYPMPHSVCLEEIRDVASWMKRVLAR
jgi:phospholipase/carboxylesterase